MTNEEFYDAHIAPELDRLANACKERGMSFVAHVEFAVGDSGSTVLLTEHHGFGSWMVAHAARSNNNVDSLIFAIIKKARETGHSSLCLARLGVPLTPAGADGKGVTFQ